MKLHDLVAYARTHSPFYRELYKSLPATLPENLLAILPVVDSTKFWQANTLHDNQLLTGAMENGIVFKSGGTTGAPKFSVFTRDEWTQFCRSFGRGLAAGGLTTGERVINLFYAGELYASFIFIMKSFEEAVPGSLHLPVGGATAPESVLKTIADFNATTIAGTPTLLLQLAEKAVQLGVKAPSLKRLLFGGESLYPDQRERLLEIFPGVTIQSIGYASVDAGLLGYADQSCEPEEHRMFGEETIYEILDEDTGEIINDVGVAGKAYITYLDRKLMPVIRYPVGDRACWVDELGQHADRRFKLLGRSEEAARVGVVSLYYDDIRDAFLSADIHLSGFQIVVRHADRLDQLVVRVAPSHAGLTSDEAVNVLLAKRPMLADEVKRGNIHKPKVEIVQHAELEKNPRTGKLKRVIDERHS